MALRNISIFNHLFPDASYKVVGYSRDANDKYYVKDVHYGNVIEQKDGKLVVIDANATYNEGYKRELLNNGELYILTHDSSNQYNPEDSFRFYFSIRFVKQSLLARSNCGPEVIIDTEK